MGLLNILIILGILGVLFVGSVVMMRSQVRYLRRLAAGKDAEGRARLLRDFLKFGAGG